MKRLQTLSMFVLLVAALSISTALAGDTVRMIAGAKPHDVRAVKVGGAWYVSADDVARALGNGASFDPNKRLLLASASDRAALLHTVDRVGGGFASDGTVAARLVSVKTAMSFQGNTPDPGAHFVFATIQLKNLSDAAVPLWQVQTSLVTGPTHVDDGQFYTPDGSDVVQENATPGEVKTYLDVFEIDDGVHPDAILVHPPFAPTTGPVDMLLQL